MTNTIAARIRRLEQFRSDCPLCHGEGKIVVEYSHPDMAELHAGYPVQSEDRRLSQCIR